MEREMIYKTWVPADGVWSLWARPVLFAQMPNAGVDAAHQELQPVEANWAPAPGDSATLVIDLPGEESVRMGLALAGRGYRPVPLYNACTGPNEVVDQKGILRALRVGADYLASLSLPADAGPAFLVDAGRMIPPEPIHPGRFDNRWKVFPQDFPSAALLRARGFRRTLLVQRGRRQPREDLAHVLRRWQDAGIAIDAKDIAETAAPAPISVDRPPLYRATWYRVLELFGLRRNFQGGFGGVVPSHG